MMRNHSRVPPWRWLRPAVVGIALAAGAGLLVALPRAEAPATPVESILVDDMILHADQLGPPESPSATSVFSVSTRPWPNGVIPVAFDASVSSGQRDQFLRNCNQWGARAPGVGCVVRTAEPVPLFVYNRALPFNGGQSTVGYSTTGTNQLTITPNAWADSLIMHEVGHAFGFMHEHQRPDRDAYVTIDASNILPGYAGNFTALAAASAQVYGPYDFRSIMHYVPNSFAVDPSRPNIIARPPYQSFQPVMGRATALSDLDLGGIVAIYGAVPEAPIDLIAGTGAGSATLSWRQPATGGRPSYFQVAVGRAPGAADLGTFNVGVATTVSGGVAPGTYYARVTAVNERGSATSVEVPFAVTPRLPPPGTPRNFSVTAAGSTLTLAWLPAASGGTLGSYVVEAGSQSGLSNIYNGAVGTATTLTAQVPLGTYFIRVRAQNAAGISPPAAEQRVDVTSHCVVPSAPVLSASRSGNLVSATWSVPAGGPLTGFLLQAGRTAGGVDLVNASVGLSTSASGTLAAGTYYIRVVAQAACGTSAPSNEAVVPVP